jgi:hypothetical protein
VLCTSTHRQGLATEWHNRKQGSCFQISSDAQHFCYPRIQSHSRMGSSCLAKKHGNCHGGFWSRRRERLTSQGRNARLRRPLLQRTRTPQRSCASTPIRGRPCAGGAAARASPAAAEPAGSRSAERARSAPRSRPVLCAPPLSRSRSASAMQSCRHAGLILTLTHGSWGRSGARGGYRS